MICVCVCYCVCVNVRVYSETIEALIHALNSFNGGVLLVSHDQYFLSSVAKEYWAFNTAGEVEVFYDLDEAKPFSYAQLEFTATNKEELIKQAQQAQHTAQRLKDKQREQQSAAQVRATASGDHIRPARPTRGGAERRRRLGKKKRRTKRGSWRHPHGGAQGGREDRVR